MVNERLKNTILEAVEEKLSGDECPFVMEAYEELVERGFTGKRAKENIAAVLMEQMYGILQDKKEYDETSYQRGLEEMLEDTFPTEDEENSEQDIWLGWEDEPFYMGQVDFPQQPVVKEKKIYPNALCPCGSGKKYKKCCGKN